MKNERPSQRDRALQYLETGAVLDQVIAGRKLGIGRLPNRICELVKLGHVFERGWRTYTSELYGTPYDVRTYKLVKVEVQNG